jgi:hypothetical protein
MTDMAIEFESVVEGDGIRIPEAYRNALTRFTGSILVTLREGESAAPQKASGAKIIPRRGSGPITEANFAAMRVNTRNWKFDRRTANER